MALLNQSVQVYGQISDFFSTLRAGTAPPSFTRQFLRDIGFKSSNHMQFIPLLKGLGFLSPSGVPTDRYREFLDASRWKEVLALAVREAYHDIFIIKTKPTSADLQVIAGKYKSTYNLSDTSAERAARTFLALCAISDQKTLFSEREPLPGEDLAAVVEPSSDGIQPFDIEARKKAKSIALNYNIQIQLPATKDLEVYNAIFKSLREHLVD